MMRESGFWGMLGARERESLGAAARPRSYGDKSFLCLEGEPSTHVFIVLSGWVKIMTASPDGREMLAALRGEGDIVGDLAQVTSYRTATVQAAGPVRTLIVSAGQFETFLDAHPEASRAYRRTATEHQIAAHNSQRSKALFSGPQRLAALLLELDGTAVPLSQGELASLIGSSRSTVTRALRNWRSRKILTTHQRRITIADHAALRRIAGS